MSSTSSRDLQGNFRKVKFQSQGLISREAKSVTAPDPGSGSDVNTKPKINK